jgi:hypothetical protein
MSGGGRYQRMAQEASGIPHSSERPVFARESWAVFARTSREVLGLLGYPIDSPCLPDEATPCGDTFADHSMAHMAAIKAVIDHQLNHLRPPAECVQEIYDHTTIELLENCRSDLHPAETGGQA